MKRGGTDDPDLVDLMGSNRSIQPLAALMVIREARYLSPNDFGKIITVPSAGNVGGVLQGISAAGKEISIYFEEEKPVFALHIYGDTPLIITGTDSKER